MQKITILYIFLWISGLSIPLFGQEEAQNLPFNAKEFPWQEQLLHLVDMEDLGEDAYNELLEELSELVIWSDTTPSTQNLLKQQIILSSNRCLNLRAGFIDQSEDRKEAGKAYLGDPWRQSIRYRLQHGDRWQAGVSAEKDPGEKWQNRFPFFDSWHAYLRYKQPSRQADIAQPKLFTLEDAVIGHYRLRIGYGLTMNQSFSLGKQYFYQQMAQPTNRITPFASNAESEYMQGMALNMRIGKHLHILPYLSIVQIDGNLSVNHHLTTLYTDGLHRTKTELSHRHASWQTVIGARLGWRDTWYEIGLHILNTQFEYPYTRKEMSHNHNYFRGQSLTQFATDYQLHAFRNTLKGEFAIDDHSGFASLTSLQTKWNDSWQSALLYHYYSNDYHQLHGNSIGENSELQGEQGITLNLTGSLSKNWQILAMADWFHFSQPQYQEDEPKDGYETLLRGIYSHSWLTSSIGYKTKLRNENLKHSIDGVITINSNKYLLFKTQIRKRISQENSTSQGFAIAQAVGYKSNLTKSSHINLEAQAAYFDTDDYSSRIYINEKNILYGFGYPMLYGKGVRYNLTCNLKIGTKLNVDIKYALSNYANKTSISSELQEIKGNNQHDLWLQLRYSY